MSLKTKRLLLRLLALVFFAGAGGIFVSDPFASISDADRSRGLGLQTSAVDAEQVSGPPMILKFEEVWGKQLQRVLFDPPPPPPQVIEKPPPPPLNVKLVGTMIDSANSQAIIQDQKQNVYFRSLGEAVTPAHPATTIEEILPNAITVRQQDDLTTLNIE